MMIEKLFKIAEGLNHRFGGDDDPFKITRRLLEEAGEVAAEINHREDCGVKQKKHGNPDPQKNAHNIPDLIKIWQHFKKTFEGIY